MESAFRSTWTCLLLAFVVLALCIGGFAQGGGGELTGQVTDSTGAVVSGVEIKLTNSATGEVRTTTTTPAGTYRFPQLEIVGTYSLEITNKGFKSVKVQNIVATVGQITTRDVKLEVGAATEQVTVEAGAQLVQTEDSSLSQDVDRRVWQDMPLEDRSQNSFIGLLPGAEPAANAMLGTDRGAAVNGTRSGTGNFMVEGFDNNDQGLGGGGSLVGPGGANTTISPDAIEEYRVIDGTPSAEYGKAGGFVTDTVLKSGTNQWHGSLYEYNRIQALAANSWFSNAAGEQDQLVRNQFGGSVGGPIIKDRTFFYFTAEAHRLRTATPLTGNTYTQAFQSFVSSGAFETFQETNAAGVCMIYTSATCPGVFAPQATTGPVYNSLLAAQSSLPLCGATNCTNTTNIGQGAYTSGIPYPVNVYGTITLSQPEILNQMRYSTKFDHKLTSKDQLTAAFLYDNADFTIPLGGGDNTFGPTEDIHGRAQNAGVTWSHTFSPTILNQARMAYTRHTANFPTTDPGAPNIVTAFDEPNISIGNTPDFPQYFTENEFSYKDDLSVTHGKHNFKGGAEFRRTRNGSSFDSFKYGYIAVDDTEDLLTDATFTNTLENYIVSSGNSAKLPFGQVVGSIAATETSLNPTTGQLPVYYRGYRANEVAMYIQDDWRIHPRLTVNLGLRWEYFGPPHNFQPNIDANFYTGVNATVPNPGNNPFYLAATSAYYGSFATGTVQQRNSNLWNKDLHNFGPRVGFAYDLMGNQKIVIRGGFGINYDRLYNNVFENIRFNPPDYAIGLLGTFAAAATVTPAQTSTLYTFPYTGTSTFFGAGLTPSLRAVDQNLETAYYEQAHLGVQYQLGKDFVWESNYVGTFGHRLMDIEGRNNYDGEEVPGFDHSPINPAYSNISFRTNCCDSNYHGFQTTLRKRFSSGLQFNANYTYAKAMDDVSDAFTTKNAGGAAYPTDSENPKLDYGPADFNVKSRIVGSFVYDLPFAKASRWIGGWNVSGVVSWQTGPDFSVSNTSAGVDSNEDGQHNDRANYIGPGSITNAINHNVSPATGYLNSGPSNWGQLNASSAPGNYTVIPCPSTVNMGLWCSGIALGQMERNTLVGPSFFNTDFGVKKTFKISERAQLRAEANFFNIFNHPNFFSPVSTLNSGGEFGKSISTFSNQQSGGPRITQLALRFDF
jgi:Carboxypeptidase regulatory-like domain